MDNALFYVMFFMLFVPTAVTAIEIMKLRKLMEAKHDCGQHGHSKAA